MCKSLNDAEVNTDLKNSVYCVNEKIMPVVRKLFPDWHLMQVEGKEDEVCSKLDMSCGIDYLMYSDKMDLVYGVASRIQYGANYRTFTVRKSRESGALTEYHKRSQAIFLGGLYPKYSMQAYVIDDGVAGLAMTKTADLIDFIAKDFAEERQTLSDKIGQAAFYVCEWDKMKACGYTVREYSA